MRLGPFDPNNIRVRRGEGGGLPIGGGSIGCGTLILAAIAYFVFGADPSQFLGGFQGTDQGYTQTGTRQGGETGAQICHDNQYATEACNALSSLNDTWRRVFQQANVPWHQPELVFYQGGTRSGCGAAQSAMGPFYCPNDEGIYIDTSFYDQMAQQLGAKGDFARYYVIAHEYGHHVQKLTGVADQIASAQEQDPERANQYQVMMELQADCYAGVWAGKNRNLIEPGDFEEGMRAASAIGDDTLARNAGQAVTPETFTHGTSAQRMGALRTGMQSADDTACDKYVRS
ncbi:MAG: neutral zinc metallopeptidase [Porphyrobacter sp.]|nr:neutral zinc metallopeptidase [Porphyrobacter sp.]